MTALAIAASLLIGVLLGILGGGGSMLTVPILVYLAGQDTKQAITTSLFVVGVTSLAGLVSHARAGRVRWRTGTLFGLAGMAGAYAGGRLAAYIPDTVLLVAFALMMLATAAAMLRGPRKPPRQAHRELPLHRLLLQGLVVGVVTGVLGAGGGFLIVPALALLAGLPMGIAVGTSLLVIAMNSFAGLAGHFSGAHLDWSLALAVTAAAVLGSLIGGRFAGRIPQHTLRAGFGWFVVAMGLFVLSRQTGPFVLAAVPAIGAGLLLRRRRAHRAENPPGAAAPAPEPAGRH
ncbi:sulfite exporter TauE/SafE family protein [Streptomyces silvisoli]|uniref:Probable membrane transporter protein n=1 Tax=Streptomyces silvisoli TaxID=3034235 RepID=A0ABT5ZNW8_9ACTN|nr:sulfite exporter TauE/SafE family protein [Streptomyces silvisoli]MDF3291280.1 sulfite exporter TauE/SafE family protein [Streptomyces silvisoli]